MVRIESLFLLLQRRRVECFVDELEVVQGCEDRLDLMVEREVESARQE